MPLYDALNYQWAEVHYRSKPVEHLDRRNPAALALQLWELVSTYWPMLVYRPADYLQASERGSWQWFLDRFVNCFELVYGDIYLVEDITQAQCFDRYGFQIESAEGFLHLTRQARSRFTVTFPRLARSQANIFDALKNRFDVTYAIAGVL